MTMNRHWGWNKNDSNWKSSDDLIRKLVDIASKGGNFLLNIGPKPDGTFPQESIDRLAAIGRWMDINGAAIYGTSASPFGAVPFGRVTAKLGINKLYLHVFDWPADKTLELPGMGSPIKSVYLMSHPETMLKYSTSEKGLLQIHVPEKAPTAPVSVVVVEYEGKLSAVPYVPLVNTKPDGSFDLSAKLAETTKPIQYEPKRNCLGYWVAVASASWLLDVKEARKYHVSILQACPAKDAGTSYTIRIGQQELKAKAKATGGWEKFMPVDLGAVELPAGRIKVIIAPDKKPAHALMNLRSIRLVPLP
jgi:alpha-L-fucosidase